MAKTPTGNQHQTIRCKICGEEYATTYRRCPFCGGVPSSDGTAAPKKKPLPKRRNNRGGGYHKGPTPLKVITTVLGLALIVAAICIVVNVVKPLVDRGRPQDPPEATVPPQPTATMPVETEAPVPTETPQPTAEGFTLNLTDYTAAEPGEAHDLIPAFYPDGTTGEIEWVSSNPQVASVDEKGHVIAYGKVGGVSKATITATMKGTDITQTCIVRCGFDAPGASQTPAEPESKNDGSITLNYTDFTMPAGSNVQMRVDGSSSTPVWSIKDTSVATVNSDGLVRMVNKGNTTLVCKVDGQTLTCEVRCNG